MKRSPSAPVPSQRVSFGRRAERLVAAWMSQRGMQIVASNQRVGPDELDLIARDGLTLVVCEVRSSSSDALYDPIETIDDKKVARIRRGTARWIAAHRPNTRGIRFDAASVIIAHPQPRITYYKDAF